MAQDNSIWKIPGFLRWRQASSAASPDYLLLDGGELTNQEGGSWQGHAMTSTIVIDLRKSWTNATVAVAAVYDKPHDFPFARRPYLWYNSYSKDIETIGGQSFLYGGYSVDGWNVKAQMERNDIKVSPANSLWRFALPGSDGNLDDIDQHWTSENSDFITLSDTQTSGMSLGAGTTTKDSFYGLGGYDDKGNAISELVQIDFQSHSLTNLTASGFGTAGYGAENQAVFTPLFGKEGVIIYIGGYAPGNGQIDDFSSTGLVDMSTIMIYDIAKQTFLSQTATVASGSTKPRPRWGFCAVAASEEGSSTVDIFVHGGVFASETDTAVQESYAKVFVLSLPNFVWTEIPRSMATQRCEHTCQLIGNRQMAVLGGDNSQSSDKSTANAVIPDPWPNGIGIFDVSAWEWSSKYDHTAKPYQRAQQLVDMSNNQFTAQSWDSEAVQNLFHVQQPPAHSIGNGQGASSGGNGSGGDSGGSNAGAIAGGVVGAILGLTLIALAVWIFMRKKKKNQVYSKDQEAQNSSSNPSYTNAGVSPIDGHSSGPSSAYPTDSSDRSGETRWPAELPNSQKAQELESPTTVAELYSPNKTFADVGRHPAEQQQGVYRPTDHFTSAQVFKPQEVHEIGSSDIPGKKSRRPRRKR